jgi:hypothetical protein
MAAMKKANSVVLSDLLSPAAIALGLAGRDRNGVLGELVNQIPALAKQPAARQTLLRALQEREQLHSTGIGDGIALPHARNAVAGLVDTGPSSSLGAIRRGLNMGRWMGLRRGFFFCWWRRRSRSI